ncbi:hypothetical protein [Actinoallomurus sp. NPDC052274]|uniref:hypothetical protein n=1 Tax=Actinoallomurus sp. NPDC052274 TaxID=3155420 RepID=UPI0034301250
MSLDLELGAERVQHKRPDDHGSDGVALDATIVAVDGGPNSSGLHICQVPQCEPGKIAAGRSLTRNHELGQLAP